MKRSYDDCCDRFSARVLAAESSKSSSECLDFSYAREKWSADTMAGNDHRKVSV